MTTPLESEAARRARDLDAMAVAALVLRGSSAGLNTSVSAAKTGTQRLDARDIKILSILQREGRISKTALAERVNLSSTPCWERLRRLEDAGIIESYGAQISLRAFGPVAIVFVEVKHRVEEIDALQAVTPKGRQRIVRAAEFWLAQQNADTGLDLRFDVVAVMPGRLPRHYRGLFDAKGAPW